ncbi:RrF2 family transcriptional regulator [Nonomuraea ferruginea]
MSEGVEWALHTCLNLTWIEDGRPVPAAVLADYFKLPPAYLNKQLQALARAGIVSSVSGPRGGFQLARDPRKITVLDVVVAIEGPEDAFQCAQILRDAPRRRAGDRLPGNLCDLPGHAEGGAALAGGAGRAHSRRCEGHGRVAVPRRAERDPPGIAKPSELESAPAKGRGSSPEAAFFGENPRCFLSS